MDTRKLFLTTALALTLVAPAAQAQTYTVLHRFTFDDGAYPVAGVTIDSAGNLYGTASSGGSQGVGTVFRMARSGSGWSFHLLYSFYGWTEQTTDGSGPYSRVVIGSDGVLYGTTHSGGDGNGCRELHGCGILYSLKPRDADALRGWQETVVFMFGDLQGNNPDRGDLVFDRASNLYGTTRNGGAHEQGTVYELTPNQGGGWTEQVIHSFTGSPDGASPLDGLVLDGTGKLYGTTSAGGVGGWGTIYQLTSTASGWIESVLHNFQNGTDGRIPISNMIFDDSGNLYGVTETGGGDRGATLFDLMLQSDGIWQFNTLFAFPGPRWSDPYWTHASVVMDSAGNLYGTNCTGGAYKWGSVFKLTRSNGAWTYTSLHEFTGGDDGGTPFGNLSLDSNGNLYGTTYAGGLNGNGVVFELTP